METVAERALRILDRIAQNSLNSSDFNPQADARTPPSTDPDSVESSVGGGV